MALFDDIKKDSKNIKYVEMVYNGKPYKIYYKPLTGAEFDKIQLLSKAKKVTIREDRSEVEEHYIDDNKLRLNIILVKSCDENGKPLFQVMNPDHKKIIENMSYEKQAYLAYIMGLKGMDDIIREQEELLKKTLG